MNGYRRISIASSILWGGIVVWLSLTPSPPTFPKGFFGWDKFLHFSAYSFLSLLLAASFFLSGIRQNRTAAYSVLLSISIGLSLECIQYLMHNGRTFECADIIANSLGSIAGVLSAIILFKQIFRNNGAAND